MITANVFKTLGFNIVLSLKGISVKVSDFTVLLVDRCAGLHVIILHLMFLSIIPWRYRFNIKGTFLWIFCIPVAVTAINTIRILIFTFIGAVGVYGFGTKIAHFLSRQSHQ